MAPACAPRSMHEAGWYFCLTVLLCALGGLVRNGLLEKLLVGDYCLTDDHVSCSQELDHLARWRKHSPSNAGGASGSSDWARISSSRTSSARLPLWSREFHRVSTDWIKRRGCLFCSTCFRLRHALALLLLKDLKKKVRKTCLLRIKALHSRVSNEQTAR